MDYSYYIFAFFVFLLVCVIVFLNARLKRDRKEEAAKLQPRPEDFSEREEELRALFRALERNMADMEEELSSARAEVRSQRDEVAAMLESVQRMCAGMRGPELVPKRGRGRPRLRPLEETAIKPVVAVTKGKPGPKKKTLADKVRDLNDAGIPAEKIAQELSVSRGEVELALGMERKKNL